MADHFKPVQYPKLRNGKAGPLSKYTFWQYFDSFFLTLGALFGISILLVFLFAVLTIMYAIFIH